MDVKLLAGIAAATALATPVSYVQSLQRDDGGFGDPQITAWATLGLLAAGADTGRATEYLAMQKPETATDAALVAMARAAAGDQPDDLLPRLRSHTPGRLVNATIWTILALRQAGQPVPPRLVKALLSAQRPWVAGPGLQAVPPTRMTRPPRCRRSCGGSAPSTDPARHRLPPAPQNPDGGFELTQGRGSDTQSTAWAIQALLAAGVSPGPPAFRYLQRMRRPNGSYRYNAGYVTTPLWVTSQVLPALTRKPFPLATG